MSGIPLCRIDPVEDANKIASTAPQNALEAAAELGRLDFLGVLWAHGRDEVRIDAALQKADAAPVLHPFWRKQAPRQVQARKP